MPRLARSRAYVRFALRRKMRAFDRNRDEHAMMANARGEQMSLADRRILPGSASSCVTPCGCPSHALP